MSPSTPPPAPTDRILRAILSTILAMSCFSVLNAMSKTLTTDHYPVLEVIWARYFFAFIFMLAMFLPRSGWKLFSIRRLDTQIARGLLLFFSSYLYFHGIAYMPLATAARGANTFFAAATRATAILTLTFAGFSSSSLRLVL